MSEATAKLNVAFVSDRGLSNKRPLNEDSFLVDEEHRIFVVADGVGGAQAGDIASQTAVEVLADAFSHRREGDDTEDLMEIAIQRANAAIHQMSDEHAKLSMMATTIVALHVDNTRATIGHVGDSRLYRITPDGHLQRETEDHSMVEEEVRAGRMTPEQAAHHPSRNIISRALGAEESVEVDLKTIEIADGTSFLLCSDGITRHLPDDELASLIAYGESNETICQEMKRLCYERGAEDNLTAVLVTVGEKPRLERPLSENETQKVEIYEDEDQTVNTPRPAALEMTMMGSAIPSSSTAPAAAARPFSKVIVTPPETEASRRNIQRGGEARPASFMRSFGFLLLSAVVGAAAFYGGMQYERTQRGNLQKGQTETKATVAPVESPEANYERMRREVDRAPGAAAERMTREANGAPLESTDAEFLYLYGRALMLSGRYKEAGEAFRHSLARLAGQSAAQSVAQPNGVRDPLKIEARISAAAAALKTNDRASLQAATRELDEVIEQQNAPATSGETALP